MHQQGSEQFQAREGTCLFAELAWGAWGLQAAQAGARASQMAALLLAERHTLLETKAEKTQQDDLQRCKHWDQQAGAVLLLPP